jgi:ribosomal protein S18 acetylase RimI-like enzyme
MPLHYHPATISDIPLIQSLAHRIWYSHYPGIITHEQIAYMLDWMYSAAELGNQMTLGQHFTIVYDGEEATGYYALSERQLHHYYLHKFYIETSLHRRGLGAAALTHLLALDCEQYETISLQVNRKNIKAVNFYFKHGFTIDRAEDFEVGGGYTMDDYVMIKRA